VLRSNHVTARVIRNFSIHVTATSTIAPIPQNQNPRGRSRDGAKNQATKIRRPRVERDGVAVETRLKSHDLVTGAPAAITQLR